MEGSDLPRPDAGNMVKVAAGFIGDHENVTGGAFWGGLAEFPEECLEKLRTPAFVEAADDFGLMVAGGVLEDSRPMIDAAAFRIVGAEINPANPRHGNGGGAHRAGFQRDVKVAGGEPGPAEFPRPFPDYHDFGMRRGVSPFLDPVPGGGDDRAGGGIDQNRADRHLAAHTRRMGLLKRVFHIG